MPHSQRIIFEPSRGLWMDLYQPAVANGVTVLYVFGGGFVTGSPEDEHNVEFFEALALRGYRVVVPQYRLALQGERHVNLFNNKVVFRAVDTACEDVFAALGYVLENKETLGVDASKVAIVGSSAGAITALQCDYYLQNKHTLSSGLAEGFRFSGVISLAGALFSQSGRPKYLTPPSPTMMMHGTADRVVEYGRLQLFNKGMFGTKYLTRYFRKMNYPFVSYKFRGAKHEVAEYPRMYYIDSIDGFLRETAAGSYTNQVEMLVRDRYALENLELKLKRKELYNGN